MPKLKFIREKQEIEVPEGANLREVAMANGIQLYPGINKVVNCLGHGTCGSCRVVLLNGTVENTNGPTFLETMRFKLSFLNIGEEKEMRLACQTRILGDLDVYTQPAFNWYGKPDKQPMPQP